MQDSSGQVPCAAHPNVMTGLRCSRCGKPICPKCMTRTQVGMRCPQCAGVRANPSIPTDSTALFKSIAGALVTAVIVGVLWRYIPEWGFYLSLLLGFGVVEVIAKLTNEKRGYDLMAVAMIAITIGLVISRYLLMQHLGIDIDDVLESERSRRRVGLQLMPDVIYMALAYVIAWIRFR